MSRIYLGGAGDEIPLEALPDPVTGDLPPIRILYDADGEFLKSDFVSLGYTHWEAYAIGAMGGSGGRVADPATLSWTQVVTRPVMTAGEWNLYKEQQSIYASMLMPPYGPYGGTEAGLFAHLESQFPAHNPYTRTTFSNPVLVAKENVYGGAGGGGGLHLAAGLLADLDASEPVVVGAIGADGVIGQVYDEDPWTPLPYQMTFFDEGLGGLRWRVTDTRLKELENWTNDFQYQYPGSRPSFVGPTDGSDGGASSFGGALVRASGGKGGKKAQSWVGGVLTNNAAGGEGGEGDSVTAGGGAAGSTSTANAPDGGWNGIVGEGGGGGKGGISPAGPSSGGQGSYSFADTTVYGNRGVKSGYIPGGGGGAKVGSYKYGGAAVGWNPGGAVIIRLTAVV